MAREALIFEIGARPFAAMVEETDIVVRVLERLDHFGDEIIELDEIIGHIFWNAEVHGFSPLA
jgi:hypothetical protein